MEAEKISNFLRNPEYSNDNKLEDLTEVIQKYPYFQSARFLFLGELKNKGSFKYNHEVKKTAAYTADRSVLFEFITKPYKIKENNKIEVIKNSPVEKTEAIHEKDKLEQSLNIGEPLKFSANDTHSFSEWLKLSSNKPIVREKDEIETNKPSNNSLNQKFKLIDAFIKNNPKIKPSREKTPKENLAKVNANIANTLMTETLAKIYLEQKKFDKAIKSYKILSLKYPEKSYFFVDQIKKIKDLKKLEEKGK